jgi:DNA-binding Lrp family transcriptional regulator
MHAYVLVETSVDAVEFVKAARRIPGVTAAHALFGDVDAIVCVEAASLEELERIAGDVHRTPGLKSGDTRIARSP